MALPELKSWIYNIDETTYLYFLQTASENHPEFRELGPTQLVAESIIGLKIKKSAGEALISAVSRVLEIEFVLHELPSGFVSEVLLPTKTKKLDYVGIEFPEMQLQSGLVVYLYENNEIRFAGMHAENYFDAEIDVARWSIVVEFVELGRYIFEGINQEMNRIIWERKFDWYDVSKRFREFVDFNLALSEGKSDVIYRIYRNSEVLRALHISDFIDVWQNLCYNIGTSLLNQENFWSIFLPIPTLYTHTFRKDGKETRGEQLVHLYIVVQLNEQPFWMLSENTKTFWDAVSEWAVSTKAMLYFGYLREKPPGYYNSVCYSTLLQRILDDFPTRTLKSGVVKKIIFRPYNSNWCKVSMVSTYEKNIDYIEHKQFASATGNVRQINCLFDTMPAFLPNLGNGNHNVSNLSWQNKFFYFHDGMLYRACDLNVDDYDWFGKAREKGSQAHAYKGYVQNSYPNSLLKFYENLVFFNRLAIGLDIEFAIDDFLHHWSDLDKCYIKLERERFLPDTIYTAPFANVGLIKDYEVDFITRKVTATWIGVKKEVD